MLFVFMKWLTKKSYYVNDIKKDDNLKQNKAWCLIK